MKQYLTELKEERDTPTTTVGDFNTPLNKLRIERQKISKDMEVLNYTINPFDLNAVYRI